MKKLLYAAIVLCGILLASKVIGATPNYLNCDSGSNANAGTQAAPWRTLQHALDNVSASRTIKIAGTCNERVVLGSNITLEQADIRVPAIIDGTNVGVYPGVFEIWGEHDITFSGLTIKNGSNIPGNTVKGINVLSGKGPDNTWSTPDDVGAYNITLLNNTFVDINKSDLPAAYALPVLFSSWGDSRNGFGTATRNITIIGNRFLESDTNSDTLGQPLLEFVDNVKDWLVKDNYFTDSDSGSAIEISGNRSTSAIPNHPHDGQIIGNFFEYMGESGIYITAAKRILIQGNRFSSSTRGINVYSENQGLHGDFEYASDIWIRNNVFKNITIQSLATGAIWSSEYCDVYNVEFTNNVVSNPNKPNGFESIGIYRDGAIDPGEDTECLTVCGPYTNQCGELTGESRIMNNYIYTNTVTSSNVQLLLSAISYVEQTGVLHDNNIWVAPTVSRPFILGGSYHTFTTYKEAIDREEFSSYQGF